MAKTPETTANFIHGLSDLWTRFFTDKETLEGMYEGNAVLAGQAYLDLLSNVLNWSARQTPLFRKELFKLFVIREDRMYQRAIDGNWTFEITDLGLKNFSYLYNKVLSPDVILEKSINFFIDTAGDKDELVFHVNPFNWDGAGKTPNGVPSSLNSDGVRQLAFWIPDAELDRYDLYLNFGHLVRHFEPSSEAYRALIRGIMRYYVLGPTQQNLTSAMNVIVGLPVVRNDGEVLQEVVTSVESVTVVTNLFSYIFNVDVPLRKDVLDSKNWGTLTFRAFEHLSTMFTVNDYISNPTWWQGRYIPSSLMPNESRSRRLMDVRMYKNQINNPAGLVRIGDPGFFVGADMDGCVPLSGRPTYRQLPAAIYFEKFLKYHAYVIDFDHAAVLSGAVPFPKLDFDLINVVNAGKSAYTYIYVEPGLDFNDHAHITETPVSLGIAVPISDPNDWMRAANMQLQVRDSVVAPISARIGDAYIYNDPSSMGIVNESDFAPGWQPLENGFTPIVIGGNDPYLTMPVDGKQTYDWPVGLTITV